MTPLELLKKKVAWGEEVDGNHLFDYHAIGQMIKEAEERCNHDEAIYD